MSSTLSKNPNFVRYSFLRFAVIFATHMQYTVLTFEMFRLTHDNWTIGMMSLWEVIGALGSAFIAGQYVDRRSKVRVLTAAIFSFFLLSLAVYFLTMPSYFNTANADKITYSVYAIMFGMGVTRAFGGPASFSLLSRLVTRENYNSAITSSSAAWQAGAVMGPLLGGLILGYTSITTVETIVVGVLLTALIVVLQIKVKEIVERKRTESYMESLRQGFRFVFRHEIIWSALSLDLFAVLFGGAQVLLPDFSENILHVGSIGYGWLKSASGIGSILMIVLLNRFPLHTNPGVKLLLSTAGFGMSIILFGISEYFFLSFFMLLLSGMFDAVSVIVRQSILQLYTPENMKGRVSSISSMFINSSNELGGFESGVTARWMGTVPAVVFGGTMTILVVFIMDKVAPELKKIKLS